MSQVKFTLDADAAKGVQAFLAMRNAESRVTEGMKEMGHVSGATTRTMSDDVRQLAREYEKAASSLRGGLTFSRSGGRAVTPRAGGSAAPAAGGFGLGNLPFSHMITTAAAIGLAKEYMEGAEQRAEEMATAAVAFSKEMKPLLGIGSNYANAPALRARTLSLSSAYGMETSEVVGGLAAAQTAGGNLTRQQQEELFKSSLQLSQLMGGQLSENVNLLAKLLENYGDSAGGAARVTGQLLYGYEHAGTGAAAFNEILEKLAPVAKYSGSSMAELIAIADTSTKVLGKSREAVAAFNGMMEKLPEAVEHGIITQGSAIDMIEQLGIVAAKADPEVRKLFGEKDLARFSAMAGKTSEMRRDLEAINALPANLVQSRIAQSWGDPGTANANVIAAVRGASANLDKGLSSDPKYSADRLQYEATLLGAKMRNPEDPEFMNIIGAKVAFHLGGWSPVDYLGTGAKSLYDNAKAAGNKELMERTRFQFGDKLGLFYRDALGNKIATTGEDADRLGRLRASGLEISGDQYLRLRSVEENVFGEGYVGVANAGHFTPDAAKKFLLNLNHNRDEYDALKKRGFNLTESDYLDFKDKGVDSQKQAYEFLGTKATNADASDYAAGKAKEAADGMGKASDNMTSAAASMERSSKSFEMSAKRIEELLGKSPGLHDPRDPNNHT